MAVFINWKMFFFFFIGALLKINSKTWRQKNALRGLNMSMVLKGKEQCPTIEKPFLSRRATFPIVLKHVNKRCNYLFVQVRTCKSFDNKLYPKDQWDGKRLRYYRVFKHHHYFFPCLHQSFIYKSMLS